MKILIKKFLNLIKNINSFYILIFLSCLLFTSCNKDLKGATDENLEKVMPPAAAPGSDPIASSATLFGKISSAGDGTYLPGVKATLFSGKDVVSSTQTDSSGNYSFPATADGSYTVSFATSGFVSLEGLPVKIDSENVNLNQSLTRPTLPGQIRIVLTWHSNINSDVVRDLDSYLMSSQNNSLLYHSAPQVNWPDGSSAKLDVDVSSYGGPETITISNLNNLATYTYYINNYSSSANCFAISQSGVHVDVYSGAEVIHSYDVVPEITESGVIFEIFQIVNGNFVDTKRFNNSLPAVKINPNCP